VTNEVTMVVSPGSGLGTAGRLAAPIEARLREASLRVHRYTPTTIEGMVEALDDLVEVGHEAVVIVGGDGAAHAAVQACADSDTAMTVIPAGTGNDLARALGLPKDPMEATAVVADALTRGAYRRMDLGKVGDTWFATVLCAGFDSAVNERVNRMRWPHGARRYDIAILAELAALKHARLTVRTESETLELTANSVAVGNTPYYGGGIPVCPAADHGDGWLDVTVVGDAGRLDLLRILPSIRTGAHVDHPKVTTLRAREISLTVDAGWIGYADGERIRPLPLDVRCVPDALRVVGT
jgi:diacylglycerol kinase (ATP)